MRLMPNTFFTSDTHFGHANIIRYSKRPVLQEGDLDDKGGWINRKIAQERNEEMDEIMIKRWNEKIERNDTVYHLGDFSFARKPEDVKKYFNRLNGNISLIYGNHDKKHLLRHVRFNWMEHYKVVTFNDTRIILFHYRIDGVWDHAHHGAWHLYGHSHGALPTRLDIMAFDIGVDCHDFYPLSFEEVAEKMKDHSYVSLDGN